MIEEEVYSANDDDFVLLETLHETVFAALVSIGAMSLFVAALFYSF